jgi:hypothetical protein
VSFTLRIYRPVSQSNGSVTVLSGAASSCVPGVSVDVHVPSGETRVCSERCVQVVGATSSPSEGGDVSIDGSSLALSIGVGGTRVLSGGVSMSCGSLSSPDASDGVT